MKCLNCNGIEFERKKLRLPTTVKNQSLEVIIPCNVCKKCKTPLMDAEQMNLLRRAASDKYREEHHLLTSKEIIQRREHLKLSQLGFAEYLKVGEASVKRWESYYIQDASQDDHIRMKCDLVTARNNYNILLSSYDKPDMYNGNKPFSLLLFRNTALYLQNKLKKCYPYLNYLHFYIDFLHFKRHKQSITGVKYISLRAGPCPYEFIFSRTHERFPYKSNEPYNPTLFDSQEYKTFEDVCSHYKDSGPEQFADLCIKEKAYHSTLDFGFIDYKGAKSLLIH